MLKAKAKSNQSQGKKEALREVTKDETSRINANIPKSLHRRFKAKCAEEGASMSDLIEKWISEYMSK